MIGRFVSGLTGKSAQAVKEYDSHVAALDLIEIIKTAITDKDATAQRAAAAKEALKLTDDEVEKRNNAIKTIENAGIETKKLNDERDKMKLEKKEHEVSRLSAQTALDGAHAFRQSAEQEMALKKIQLGKLEAKIKEDGQKSENGHSIIRSKLAEVEYDLNMRSELLDKRETTLVDREKRITSWEQEISDRLDKVTEREKAALKKA